MKTVLILGLAAAALSGCVKTTKFDPATTTSAKVTETLPVPGRGDRLGENRDYRLGPLDRLSIQVFGVQELDRVVQVDAKGNIAMPLIGLVPAAGETASSLSDKLQALYSERYLRNPQISVALTEALSQQVLVDGAVGQPGQYQLLGDATLMSAIAMARGTTATAQLDQVLLFRTINGERLVARYNLADVRAGRADDPEVFGDDVVVVGSGSEKLGLKDMLLLTPVLGAFYQFTR